MKLQTEARKALDAELHTWALEQMKKALKEREETEDRLKRLNVWIKNLEHDPAALRNSERY